MPRLTTAYPLRTIFAKAWCLARAGARRFGGRSIQYLAAALRQAWAEAKATAARIADQTARVLASIDGLAADVAAAAVVVPFPVRPVAPAPAPLRRAA